MFLFVGLGCIPFIVTPILAINYFSNMKQQNGIRRTNFMIGGKIVMILFGILSLVTVVGGSIYALKRIAFYKNEMRNNYIKMQERNNKSTTNENTGQQDKIKGYAKEEILKYSIKILREHGASDDEIKQEILSKFDIDEEFVDTLIDITK